MSLRAVPLALGILVAFLLIFVPIARLLTRSRDEGIDAERMRRVYVALSLYESEHDGRPAPNLGLVRRDVDPSDLVSVSDPDAAGPGPFPLDPALPNLPLRFPTRVSWSYRWDWPKAGDPVAMALDSRRGLLASWWSGPILRVNMDGAILRAPRNGGLTFGDLFGN